MKCKRSPGKGSALYLIIIWRQWGEGSGKWAFSLSWSYDRLQVGFSGACRCVRVWVWPVDLDRRIHTQQFVGTKTLIQVSRKESRTLWNTSSLYLRSWYSFSSLWSKQSGPDHFFVSAEKYCCPCDTENHSPKDQDHLQNVVCYCLL